MSAALKVGDSVEWSSQAQGHSRTKRGVIVAMIPAGERPSKHDFPDLHKGVGCGFGRPGDSYVVAVGRKHYWPLASKLRRTDACPHCKGTGYLGASA